MSFDDLEDFLADYPKELSRDAARYSLGTRGDAMDFRINQCITEAEKLLALKFPGPAISLIGTAVELMARFMLLQPLVQGAFLSEDWTAILTDRIATGRTADDRKILPDILQQYDVDIASYSLDPETPLWTFIQQEVLPARNNFIHKAEWPTTEIAEKALRSAKVLRAEVINDVAFKLGFTLEKTGKWSHIKQNLSSNSFIPWDPISGKPWT